MKDTTPESAATCNLSLMLEILGESEGSDGEGVVEVGKTDKRELNTTFQSAATENRHRDAP